MIDRENSNRTQIPKNRWPVSTARSRANTAQNPVVEIELRDVQKPIRIMNFEAAMGHRGIPLSHAGD